MQIRLLPSAYTMSQCNAMQMLQPDANPNGAADAKANRLIVGFIFKNLSLVDVMW